MLNWWEDKDQLTMQDMNELRKEVGRAGILEAAGDRLPERLLEPGVSALHRLATLTEQADEFYRDPGEDIRSRDPIRRVTLPVASVKAVKAAFTMGAIAGVAVVYSKGLKVDVFGRESNVQRYEDAQREVTKDLSGAVSMLPYDAPTVASTFDHLCVERLLQDPDGYRRPEQRRRARLADAIKLRLDLLRVQHAVVQAYPDLRDHVPHKYAQEVQLREWTRELRLGGVVWVDEYYRQRRHHVWARRRTLT